MDGQALTAHLPGGLMPDTNLGGHMRRSDIEEIEYLMDENPAEAVVFCQKLRQENGEDADLWAWLADAHIAAGAHDEALKALAQYVQLDPDWLEAYTWRAELLADLGRFDASRVELEVARAIDSEDPRLKRAEALSLELQGRFDDADAAYAEAAELDPSLPPPARYERGRARQAIQRVLRQVAKEGLKLTPVFEEIPQRTDGGRLLSRSLDLIDRGTVAVYLRNLERDLIEGSEIEELELLFEERLAALVEAN